MLFAALRFYNDANIGNRTYWYLAEFPVRAGERVFAPVGTRNRLQKAVVERTAEAQKENAPYDVALVKKVEAPCGYRHFTVSGLECVDLGGVKYDDRHYTHFYRMAVCLKETLSPQEEEALKEAGYFLLHAGEEICSAAERESVLIAGAGAQKYAEEIIRAARGEETELAFRALARRLL